jgi:chromosome segregation ATPase
MDETLTPEQIEKGLRLWLDASQNIGLLRYVLPAFDHAANHYYIALRQLQAQAAELERLRGIINHRNEQINNGAELFVAVHQRAEKAEAELSKMYQEHHSISHEAAEAISRAEQAEALAKRLAAALGELAAWQESIPHIWHRPVQDIMADARAALAEAREKGLIP